MYSWISLPSLPRTCLEVLRWPAPWSREDGRCHLFISYLFFSLEALSICSFTFGCFLVQIVCSSKALFSCDNLCGNPLPCGNHYCTKTCHALISQSQKSLAQCIGEPCEECHLPCEKVLNIKLFSCSSILSFYDHCLSQFFYTSLGYALKQFIMVNISCFTWDSSLTIIIWCWNLLVYIFFEYSCRRGSPLACITVLFHVILGSAPLAKCLWNELVTVVLWSMFLSAYTTIACLKRSKCLSVHVVDPVIGNISMITCTFCSHEQLVYDSDWHSYFCPCIIHEILFWDNDTIGSHEQYH